jgi:septum formation protein
MSNDLIRVVLASASPRRSELLTQIGMSFEVMPTDIDETEHPGEDPVSYVRRLAIEKALAAVVGDDAGENVVVIAADTTVDLDGMILAKPADDADALRMLGLLAGRTHRVHTGVAIRYQGRVAAEVNTSLVSMKASDDQWQRWYVATGEPHGKAGAYGIQGAAAVFVDSVQGSVTNVIGLPLSLLEQLLAEVGVSLLRLLTP